MSIYTFIPVIFIVLYLGYWFYMKNKNSKQAQVVNNTDFKAEFANEDQNKNCLLYTSDAADDRIKLTLSTMPAMSMV